MRAFLDNKKYYDKDGNYLTLNQIRERNQKYLCRTGMSKNERILPYFIEKYIFSFVITCDICDIVVEPEQYINKEKCCLNVCSSCKNFYAIQRHCTLCKKYMWADGFPVAMCGCHCGISVCGNCTNRPTFLLYDEFINNDDESNESDEN